MAKMPIAYQAEENIVELGGLIYELFVDRPLLTGKKQELTKFRWITFDDAEWLSLTLKEWEELSGIKRKLIEPLLLFLHITGSFKIKNRKGDGRTTWCVRPTASIETLKQDRDNWGKEQ